MSDDLKTQLLSALTEFEKGCSNDGHLEHEISKWTDGEKPAPENCPECVRAFVNHLYSLTLSPEEVARVWLNPRLVQLINKNTAQ